MDIIYRIKFHLRMKIHSVKNWWEKTILRKTDEEILAEFNAMTESLSREEKDEIEHLVMEHMEEREANRPILNPRRTMLIHSRPDEYGCNALTAPAFRQKILNSVEWAQKRGFTTFMADYYTPLGLLALETLIDLRENGADIRVYAVRSCYFGQRRTYRTIPETGTEMAFLPARADYSFHDPLGVMLTEVLPKAWLQCSERGIWFAKDTIPSYLLEAWES